MLQGNFPCHIAPFSNCSASAIISTEGELPRTLVPHTLLGFYVPEFNFLWGRKASYRCSQCPLVGLSASSHAPRCPSTAGSMGTCEHNATCTLRLHPARHGGIWRKAKRSARHAASLNLLLPLVRASLIKRWHCMPSA